MRKFNNIISTFCKILQKIKITQNATSAFDEDQMNYHQKQITPAREGRSYLLAMFRTFINRFISKTNYIENASKPPSTTHTVPVTALEASDAK